MIEQILEDVRKDAEEKLKSAAKEDIQPLLDSAVNVLRLCEIARKNGRVTLDGVVLEGEPEYVKTILLLMADSAGPDYITEAATNEYWMQDIQGIWAMVYYIYLQGALAVCRQDRGGIIEERIIALLPVEYRPTWEGSVWERPAYTELFKSETKRIIISPEKEEELKSREEKTNKRQLLNDEWLTQKLFAVRPVFQSSKLIEKLHELEKEIMSLPNQSICKMIRNVKETAVICCLYGLCNEARIRILDNTEYIAYGSDDGSSMPFGRKLRMMSVIELDKRPEEEILGAVMIMLSRIKCFCSLDEIQEG